MSSERILVVDDEENMRYLLKVTLEGEGYQVLTAASGEEALKRLEGASFDLAVVDLKMPGSIDGVQLMKEAGRIAPQTAIVVLTAYASLESAIEAVRQGAFDYITKPMEIDPLCLAIERALKRKQVQDEIRRRNEQLAFLNEVGRTITSTLNLEQILALLVEKVNEIIGVEAGSISLLDEESGELVIRFTMREEAEKLKGRRLQPGQGIAGWVAQHGQAVCVNDVRHDARFYEGVDAATGFETRSLLCVPLTYREKVTGVIEIVNKRGGEFTSEDLNLLEAVSSIAAVALENARLYTATWARADELALLNEIGLALTSTLDFSTVVHAALSQVQRLFQAENISLLQLDPRTGELHFVRKLVGAKPVEVPVRLQPGEGIAGWALEHRQPVLVEDAQNDPRFSSHVDQYLSSQTRALMAVPLLTPERAIGVIEVVSREPNAYTHDKLRTLEAIASTLAVALENARLYNELKTLLREREQAQAQLIHSEKLAALGRLTASLAHEINNPLQALRSGLRLLLNRPLDEEKRQRYLTVANREVERLIGIAERVLDFHRPSSEQPEATVVNAVLEDVLTLVDKKLQHGKIVVKTELAADLPAIEAVADQLKQVFLNIVLNAVEAMPEGGSLTMKSKLSDDGQEVLIAFTDSGGGIPQEDIAKIFEPFHTTKPKGTGLGLAISYGIVERHGGRIEVESQVGQGSTFTVRLPVTSRRAEP